MLSVKDMFVNQASLTGESLPVEKFAAPISGVASALELNNVAFMGTNVISGTASRDGRRHRRSHLFRQYRDQCCGPTGSDELRPRHSQIHLAHHPLHAGHGAACVPGQRHHERGLARSFPVRRRRGGRTHAGNAADDCDHQSRQGRHGHGRQEGNRQAPQLHPESRRDECPLHGQDGHADSGQSASGEARRRHGDESRAGTRVRLPQQLLPDWTREPARRCRARAR